MAESLEITELAGLIVDGSLKDAFGSEEVRSYCLRTLASWGCKPPTNHFLLFCCVRAGSPLLGFTLKAAGTNVAALLQKFPRVAALFSNIARICRQERDKERLKDHLLALMRGEAPDPPPLDDASGLDIVQAIYTGQKLEGLDATLRDLPDQLAGLIAGELRKLENDPVATLMDQWETGTTETLVDRIKYNSGQFAFVGRENELDLLKRFLGEPKVWSDNLDFNWLLITGDGGEGKTRLAMEFVRYRLPPGWVGRRLPILELETMLDWAPRWLPRDPTLIVIDYPAQKPLLIRQLLVRLQHRAANFEYPVRVLLLERDAHDSWFDTVFRNTGDDAALRNRAFRFDGTLLDRGLPIPPLPWKAIAQIVATRVAGELAREDFSKLLMLAANIDRRPAITLDDGARIPGPPRALFAIATAEWALSAVQQGRTLDQLLADPDPKVKVLTGLIDRDRSDFWQEVAHANNADLPLHENLLALASFTLGLSEQSAARAKAAAFGIDHLFPAASNRKLLDAITDVQAGTLRQLEPDLLGEFHALRRLTELADEHGRRVVGQFCSLAYRLGGEEAGAFAARCLRDFPDMVEQLDWLAPAAAREAVTLAPFAGLCMDAAIVLPLDKALGILRQLATISDASPLTADDVASLRETKALTNLASGIGKAAAWEQWTRLLGRIDSLAQRFGGNEEFAVEEAKALTNLASGIGKAAAWDQMARLFERLDGLARRFAENEDIAVQRAKALFNLARGIGKAAAWNRSAQLYDNLDSLARRFDENEDIAVQEAKALTNLASGIGEAAAWDQSARLLDRFDNLARRFDGNEDIAGQEAQALTNLAGGIGIAAAWDQVPPLFDRLDNLVKRFGENEGIAVQQAQTLTNLANGIGKVAALDQSTQLFERFNGLARRFGENEDIAVEEAKALTNLTNGIGKAAAWDQLPPLFNRLDNLVTRFGENKDMAVQETKALTNLARGIGKAAAWDQLALLFCRLDNLSRRFGESEDLAVQEAQALTNLASGIGEAAAWEQMVRLFDRFDSLAGRFDGNEDIAVQEARALTNLAGGIGIAAAWDQVPPLFGRLDGLGRRFGESEYIAVQEAQVLTNLASGIGAAAAWEQWPDVRIRAESLQSRTGSDASPKLRVATAAIWLPIGVFAILAAHRLDEPDLARLVAACGTVIRLREQTEQPQLVVFALRVLKSLRDTAAERADIAALVAELSAKGIDLSQIPDLAAPDS